MPDRSTRAGWARRPGTMAAVTGAVLAAVVALSSCGSARDTSIASSTTVPAATPATPAATAAPTTASTIPRGSGPVDVLYAGSLVNLMEKQIGPAFHAATGFTVSGISAGSTALATEIKGKVHRGDVFISASPGVNASLEGPANGDWVSWYLTFATSPLLLGYNPRSTFAHDLATKPWFQVLTEPGILVGRTDPVTDPKGTLTVQALTDAARADRAPALLRLTRTTSTVFPEETLVGRLQAGQLDAGFFYSSEAEAAGIPTVPLTGLSLGATYTVTILKDAPDPAGARSFVQYLLGPAGRATLTADGFVQVAPATVSGTGLPAGLSELSGPARP